jgi:hypothetical protein
VRERPSDVVLILGAGMVVGDAAMLISDGAIAADRELAATFAEPPPRLPAYQLTVLPTLLATRDRVGDNFAPGVGALLRFYSALR